MSEKLIEKLELQLAQARKDFRDLTLKDAHKLVNAAAHSMEAHIVDANLYGSGPRAAFLVKLAGMMRKMTEDELGPQPGFSRRRTIPKGKQ